MTTTVLRQKLHSYLEVADDKKIEAIYAIMEEQIEEYDEEYSDEFKAELDRRYADYKSGNVEVITAEESKRRIEELMMQLRSKAC